MGPALKDLVLIGHPRTPRRSRSALVCPWTSTLGAQCRSTRQMNVPVATAATGEGLSGLPSSPFPAGEENAGLSGRAHVQQTRKRHRSLTRQRLVDQIEAVPGDDPGSGGWSGGFANQARWDPARPREWRCWAQSGPTWSAHCGAEVAANDTLGLCQRHRRSLLEPEYEDGGGSPAADPTPVDLSR